MNEQTPPFTQKFFFGDLVEYYDVWEKDKKRKAIVLYSYYEHFTCLLVEQPIGRTAKDFAVYCFSSGNFRAWVDESRMTLMDINRQDLLPKNNKYRIISDLKTERDKSYLK